MRISALCVALWLGTLLSAQTPPSAPTAPTPAPAGADLAATKAKLSGALQKCASQQDTAFEVVWGPDGKKKKKNDGAMAFALAFGVQTSGKAKGSWHADRLHVALDGDEGDELVVAGRRLLAKDSKTPWQLRAQRHADGSALAFVPDPVLLLQRLSAWDLEVTNRAVGAIDDRPVEIVSVTLTSDQVTEAIWAGLLPESLAQSSEGGGVIRMVAGGMGARATPPPPTAEVDLAIHFDPATSVVHQLHFRGWAKANAGAGRFAGGGVIVLGGAVGGVDDEEEEDEDDAKEADDTPLVYENGLPVRPRKKTSVNDCTIRLTQHGQKKAPELSPEQQKLLGR